MPRSGRLRVRLGGFFAALLVLSGGQAVAQIAGPSGNTAGNLASRWDDIDSASKPEESSAQEVSRLIRTGHRADAFRRAEEQLAKEPHNAELRFLHASLLADMGQRDQAAAEYEKLIAEFPELPEPYNNLAVLQANRGQLKLAEATLQRALVVQPGYATAEENLGDIYIALAAENYAGASRHSPSSSLPKQKLALVREVQVKVQKLQ